MRKTQLLPVLLLAVALSVYIVIHSHVSTRSISRAGASLLRRVKEQEDALASLRLVAPTGDSTHWVRHPGTGLGETVGVDGRWERCSAAHGACMCASNLARLLYEDGSRVVQYIQSGATCEPETFGRAATSLKVGSCECEVVAKQLPLDDAKALCKGFGLACKGVTCAGDACTPRRGLPYLDGRPGEESHVKDVSEAEHHPGGGWQGKYRIDGEPTIFVSIAAFRDSDALNTVDDMFKKARFPKRVFVGLVCQRYDTDDLCMKDYSACQLAAEGAGGFCITDQVRQRTFSAGESKGPTHARSVAASLYRGEDFFFMIDAHSRFVSDWDTKVLDEQAKCSSSSKKCVLSTYPMGVDASDADRPRPLGTEPGTSLDTYAFVAHLCNSRFHDDAVLKNYEAYISTQSFWPRPQPYTGAGLLFGPGKMIIEAPFDPFVPFVWDGEEFLYTARLWTWGYDMYSPGQNILYHQYNRKGPRIFGEKRYSDAEATALKKVSYKRLQYILGTLAPKTDTLMVTSEDPDFASIGRDLPKFGLGPHRTMEQFYSYARIDIRNRAGDALKEYKGHFCTVHHAPRQLEDGPYTNEAEAL